MSESQHKASKKRKLDEGEEDEEDIAIGDDSGEQDSEESEREKRDWKVKTLDEIMQEKRRRLEADGEQRSEVIYQLSPENASPLSSDTTPKKSKSSQKDKEKSSHPRKRLGTESEEGEILSDISDADGNSSKSRKRSVKSVSQDTEMAEDSKRQKALVDEHTKSAENVSSGESDSDEDNKDEEKKRIVKEASDDSAEEVDESDSDSEETSEEEDEKPAEQVSKQIQQDSKQESEDESEETSEEDSDSDSEESNSDSSDQEESEKKEAVVSQSTVIVEEEEEAEDLHKELLKATDSQKLKERKRREEERLQQESRRREKYSNVDQRYKDSREGRENRPKHRRRSHEEREKYKQYKERYRSREDQEGHSDKRGKERMYQKNVTSSKGEARDSKEGAPQKASKTYVDPNDRVSSRDSHTYGNKQTRADTAKESDSRRGMERVPSRGNLEQLASKDKSARGNKEYSNEKSSKQESSRNRKQDKEVPVRKESSAKVVESKSKESKREKKDSENENEQRKRRVENREPLLTEQERMQFNREVVDSEHSDTDESVASEEKESEEEIEQKEEKNREKDDGVELPDYLPAVQGCRNVEEFQWLNRIEEGTYGVVYRAKDKTTGEIVALKRLKMEKEKEGFPITSLREINTLLKAQHPNIVHVREIVVGSNMDRIYIVMDYVEHDLKTLMEHMTSPFTVGEVKTLMIQLLRATAHLHDNWILHRDLKTSNLLLNNQGILKVGDFGLAREYGSPLRHYTPIVVTLWYRAPELLLGIKEYSCPIDMWSVGCIFAELLTMKALFPGKSEIDQINRIFKELGTPSDKIWPGPPAYSELPHVKKMTFTEYPFNQLRNRFGTYLTDKGFGLLNRFLTYDPKKRITAETALKSEYFIESPKPVEPSMFPTWPAKSEMQKRPRRKDYEHSPDPPEGGEMFSKLKDEGDSGGTGAGFHMPTSKKGSAAVSGFNLKF